MCAIVATSRKLEEMARGGNGRGVRGKGRRGWGDRDGLEGGALHNLDGGGGYPFLRSQNSTGREDYNSLVEGLGGMAVSPVLLPYSIRGGGGGHPHHHHQLGAGMGQQGGPLLTMGGGGGGYGGGGGGGGGGYGRYVEAPQQHPFGGGEGYGGLDPGAEEYLPSGGGYGKWREEGEKGGRGGGSGKKRRPRRGKDKQEALADNVKRTVYISDLDQQITEEQLAAFFQEVGVVADCRVCGDPNSAMRFAFVEFSKVEEAVAALEKSGLELGTTKLKVLPSKTAIVPVNKDLMPRNKEEMEQCSRTVYATNIDKKVDRDDVQRFFEALCGPVGKLRLLGDHAHSTRIAFVEFDHADSALAALSCSGALLGTMPIRVSPSKTPVRNPKESELIR